VCDGAQPNLLYDGYGVFPGGTATTAWRWPPTPRLKKSRAILLLPLWDFVACSKVNFTFTITFTPVYHVTLFTIGLFLLPFPKILGAVLLGCLWFLKRKICDTRYCQIWKLTMQRVRWSGARTPSGAMIFHQNLQTVSGTHPVSYSYSFLGLKRLRPEIKLLLLYSAEVQKEQNYVSASVVRSERETSTLNVWA
jgi:hypothetical protein